jgi:arginine decarboxylase
MNTILGNRIPYEYFITKGKGEADIGSEGLPYETGSYDAALNNAGIEEANIIQYTSVIPPEAKEISIEEGLSRVKWGEVLECIKAQANGHRGSFISAAVMTTSVTDNHGNYLGGFACEYSGKGTRKQAEESLEGSIAGMIARRGFGNIIGKTKLYKINNTDKGYKIYPGKDFIYDSLKITQEHGSVLTAICFVSHKYPIIKKRPKTKGGKKLKTKKMKTKKIKIRANKTKKQKLRAKYRN